MPWYRVNLQLYTNEMSLMQLTQLKVKQLWPLNKMLTVENISNLVFLLLFLLAFPENINSCSIDLLWTQRVIGHDRRGDHHPPESFIYVNESTFPVSRHFPYSVTLPLLYSRSFGVPCKRCPAFPNRMNFRKSSEGGRGGRCSFSIQKSILQNLDL